MIGKIVARALVVLLLSGPAIAIADQTDAMIEMAIGQMQRDGDLDEITSCLGVSEAQFLDAFRNTMRYCMDKYGFDVSSQEAMTACFESRTKQQLDVSDSVMDRCEERFAEDEEDEAPMDYSRMSDDEIEAQIALEQRQAMEMMESILAMSKEASKGTEGSISLPIYSPSEIVLHHLNGMTDEQGEATLPVATFSSSDSVAEIAVFYRARLTDFEEKDYDGEMIIFMETLPRTFDPLADIDVYMRTPHVAIYEIASGSKGTNTTIEITYRK